MNQQFKCSIATMALSLPVLILLSTPVAATDEIIPLGEYLKTMDRTEVLFSGRIKYDGSDGDFTFYNEDRKPFGVTIDAGRDTRERIETECENSSFMVSYAELCTISGAGSVEIRGSRIHISVESVNRLEK